MNDTTDLSLIEISKNCLDLKILSFERLFPITDDGLITIAIVYKCQKLKYISLVCTVCNSKIQR
jgi:hypothetical protein